MAGAPGRPIPRELRRALTAILQERGEKAMLKLGGISHIALARSIAGMPVRGGTRALCERLIERVAEQRAEAERTGVAT